MSLQLSIEDESARGNIHMMEYFFWGGGFENLFFLMFFLIFVLVIGSFAVTLVKGIGQWNQNNHSPRLTVNAQVAAKRMDVRHHSHGQNEIHSTSSSTWYYVTFEVDSGDRMEFTVDGREFGMLVEGDQGQLSFQGTRYLGFER